MSALPTFAELLARTDGRAGTSWGVFGDDDELGTINLLTPERTAAATALVTRGTVFSLNLDLELPDPPLFGRGALQHTLKHEPTSTDDRYDSFYPQASSQWDALSHVEHPELGFYNGVQRAEITGQRGSRLGIDRWARRGIAGRFVLADVGRWRASVGRPIDLAHRDVITVADLDSTLEAQGTVLVDGCILLVRTGWLEWLLSSDRATQGSYALISPSDDLEGDWDSMPHVPGLEASEATAAWLWNHRVAAVAADNPGLEALPFSRTAVDTWLHYRLIAMLGMAIGELWQLGELAADCASDGRYEGLLTAAPLNKVGGSGSPANALAIK